MNEKPILFSGEMVRAILAGRKTQTRRVVKPDLWDLLDQIREYNGKPAWQCLDFDVKCPWDGVDRLWVRETWRIGAWNADKNAIAVDYKADGYCRREWLIVPDNITVARDSILETDRFKRYWIQSTDDARKVYGEQDHYKWKPGESPCRWRPSIHMPWWASRITLEITGIRVERVQNIHYNDAVREGVSCFLDEQQTDSEHKAYTKKYFRDLWDSINAKRGYSWESNPWVWVIEFKRVEGESK